MAGGRHRTGGDGVPPGPGRRRPARPAGAEPDLRRTGGGLEPGLAARLAAGLGPGRGGAGPDRTPERRRADRGLPAAGCSRPRACWPRGTWPTGRASPTTAGPSWTGWAGRCGRRPRWPQALPAADRADFVRRHPPLLDRSAAAARAAIDNPRTLPPVSADYWEVRERRPTLSTAALLAAGLESAAELYAVLGRRAARRRPADAAARLRSVILARFGPDGFPRHLGGRADSVDLGVSFLLPPFSAQADPAAVDGVAAGRPGDGPAGRRAGARRVVAAGRDQLDQRDRDVRPDRRRAGGAGAGAGRGSAGSTGTGRRPGRSRRRCWPTAARPRWPRWPGPPPPSS